MFTILTESTEVLHRQLISRGIELVNTMNIALTQDLAEILTEGHFVYDCGLKSNGKFEIKRPGHRNALAALELCVVLLRYCERDSSYGTHDITAQMEEILLKIYEIEDAE